MKGIITRRFCVVLSLRGFCVDSGMFRPTGGILCFGVLSTRFCVFLRRLWLLRFLLSHRSTVDLVAVEVQVVC